MQTFAAGPYVEIGGGYAVGVSRLSRIEAQIVHALPKNGHMLNESSASDPFPIPIAPLSLSAMSFVFLV